MSFLKHLPNTITCLNAFSGCVAVTMAFDGKFEWALAFIFLAAVFDFFDGFTARLVNHSSPMGKELDSLADAISFGFAPASMVYVSMKTMMSCEYVPYVAFLIAVFSVLRLAKFNIDERQSLSFIGLPTPANAVFWGGWVTSNYLGFTSMVYFEYFLVAMVILSSYLLVSELPMFALKFKQFTLKKYWLQILFLVVALILFIVLKIESLSIIIVIYIVLSIIQSLMKK